MMKNRNKQTKEEKVCSICQCVQLAKTDPIINKDKMYNICGKCLISINEIAVKLSLACEADNILCSKHIEIENLINRLNNL